MKIIFKILKNIPRCFANFLFVPIYHFCGIFKRDENLWIFASWRGEKYNDSSRILFEYVNKNLPKIKAVWISRDKNIVRRLRAKNLRAFSAKSPKALALSFRAGKFFSTTGGEMFYGFLKGCDFYEMWHGMPLKKIGRDDNFSDGEGGKSQGKFREFINALNKKCFPWRSFWTMPNVKTLTSSEFFTPFLESAFGLPREKILPVGLPRCDALFFHNRENLIEDARQKFPQCKIILYMPTFRTGSWTKIPFNPFDKKYGFDAKKFFAVLEEKNIVFLYKPHFIDLNLLSRSENFKNNGRFISINDESYDELYNFAGLCDALVTDYSSIYFDFIITKKPVILAPFDLEEYLATARGHYFSYDELDGVKVKNWDELLDVLKNEKYCPASDETIEKFAKFDDGKSCAKLCERARK